MEFIRWIAGMYLTIGVYMTVLYTAYVGKLIGKKYKTNIIDGCCRFILADRFVSNVKVIFVTIIKWPIMFITAVDGSWGRELPEMVEQNDYEY